MNVPIKLKYNLKEFEKKFWTTLIQAKWPEKYAHFRRMNWTLRIISTNCNYLRQCSTGREKSDIFKFPESSTKIKKFSKNMRLSNYKLSFNEYLIAYDQNLYRFTSDEI